MAGNEQDQDFKYLLQDVTKIYLGARYTLKELFEEEKIPYHVKKMICKEILPILKNATEGMTEEEGWELTLADFVELAKKESALYLLLKQANTQIRFTVFQEAKKKYESRTMKFVKYCEFSKEGEGTEHPLMIQEIILSKLALLTI